MEGDSRDLASPAELGVADALVALQVETRNGRERHLLQVRKRRGAQPLTGAHPYIVGGDGVQLWRRFESCVRPTEPVWSTRRAAFRKPPFAALVTYLPERGVTTYLTYEIARYGSELDLAGTSLAVLAENLLLLRAVEADGRLRRFFSIMHVRFSDHDHRLHEYTIEAG